MDHPEIQQVTPPTCRTSGFVIGALIATACFGIGALVVWLILRKKESWVLSGMLAAKQNVTPAPSPSESLGEPSAQLAAPLPPPMALVETYPPPAPPPPAPEINIFPSVPKEAPMVRSPRNTHIRNLRLPTYGIDRDAIRLATATDVPCRVTVRITQPPGTQVALAFDFNDLTGNAPSGDVLLLGAGDMREIKLAPRQDLYAKATLAGSMASVIMAEAIVDVP